MAKKRLAISSFPGITRAAVTLALVLPFSGCSAIDAIPGGSTMVGVLAGVVAWARQDWPASIVGFMESLSRADAAGDSRARDYALYGLGSTYLANDERAAASARLDAISPDAPPEIIASAWYQRGIIAYREGDYEGAAGNFRRSMEIGGPASDARINMELSLRSRDESRARTSSAPAAAKTDPDTDPAAETIFNLIRKKEQDRWKNQEDTNSSAATPDY